MGARAHRSWREAMQNVKYERADRLDWLVMLAKMNGLDMATSELLEAMYPEDMSHRYGEVLVWIEDYREPGTKIGALP